MLAVCGSPRAASAWWLGPRRPRPFQQLAVSDRCIARPPPALQEGLSPAAPTFNDVAVQNSMACQPTPAVLDMVRRALRLAVFCRAGLRAARPPHVSPRAASPLLLFTHTQRRCERLCGKRPSPSSAAGRQRSKRGRESSQRAADTCARTASWREPRARGRQHACARPPALEAALRS